MRRKKKTRKISKKGDEMLRKFAWSKEEEEALKELYPKYLQGLIDREDFKSVFPKRTFESLKRKADRLEITGKSYCKINKKKYNQIIKRIKI